VIVAFGYLAPMFDVNLGCFEVVFFSALAFGLGTFIKITYVEKLPIFLKVLICVLHIIAGAVLIRLDLIETAVIKELIMVAGICSSIAFISIVAKIGVVAKFLDFINKYSFQIYLLHTIFTAGIRIVLMRLNINQWYIHLVAGCICGLVCSVIAAIIAEKVKVFNICFFPSKTLKKIKKMKEPQQC
jgi:peptidoglycan/LPS O-acetylase OafA/YrhL